jgi:hypothetical protein
LNYRFLNFLNFSCPSPIFQYVIVVIKSNPNPNGTILYDHIFIANIPGQKVPITLLYNHHESLINAAVLIGKIHKVHEISGHGWFGRWRSRCHGSCGKACAGHQQATKHGIRNALRNSFCLRGYQIRMQTLRPLPMLHRIRPRQPSNLSNLSNQILMTRDSPQTKLFTKASNGTTRQTMARRPIQRFSSTSTRPFIQTRKSHALLQTHTTSPTHGLTNPNPLPTHKTARPAASNAP